MPIELKDGEYYRQTNGEIRAVGHVGNGVFGNTSGLGSDRWKADGTALTTGTYDLIEHVIVTPAPPTPEPKRGTAWVNIYPGFKDGGLNMSLNSTRDIADAVAEETRLACVRVDWVEGQFDGE